MAQYSQTYDFLPACHNLPSAICGDTFREYGPITISVNGASPTSPLSAVSWEFFRTDKESLTADFTLSTGNGGVVINDASQWQFTVPAFDITLQAGSYSFTVETIATNGSKRTYIQGIWTLKARH